jgi:predicted SnoaL-like aldol condensation-catalyzing enzyme
VIYIETGNIDKIDDFTKSFSKAMPLDEDKQIYTLESTIDSGDDFIKGQMKRQNIPYYTDLLQCSVLEESGEDSGYETYKGIFIDRDSGDFKVLSGRFPDKKAMIRKYGDESKPYIARKVFEAPVFKWIEENAKSALDAYLMYSTAMSKWKHISMLKDYYYKAMEEMPEMFSKARQLDVVTGNEGDLHEDTITDYHITTPKRIEAKLQFFDANNDMIEEQWDKILLKASDKNKTKSPLILNRIKDFFKDSEELKNNTEYVKVLFKDGKESIVTKEEIKNGFAGDDSYAKGYNIPDDEYSFRSHRLWQKIPVQKDKPNGQIKDFVPDYKEPEQNEFDDENQEYKYVLMGGHGRVNGVMFPVDAQGNQVKMDELNSINVGFELDNFKHGLKDAQVWKQAKRQLSNVPEELQDSVYGIAFILPVSENSPAIIGTPNSTRDLEIALQHKGQDYSSWYQDGYIKLFMKKSDVFKNASIAELIKATDEELDISSLLGWSKFNPKKKTKQYAAAKNTGKSFYAKQFATADQFNSFRNKVNKLRNKEEQ